MDEMIRKVFDEAKITLDKFISDEKNFRNINEAARIMVTSMKAGGKVISCGNGGSMCDAMHFAEELSGRFRQDRKPLPAVAISDASHITCVGNDYGFDRIFSRYVEALGNSNDVLLAISTSGNSANIIKAAEKAKEKGMKIVALTGQHGGKLAHLCDIEIRSPDSPFADRAQEIHIKVIHALILAVESSLS